MRHQARATPRSAGRAPEPPAASFVLKAAQVETAHETAAKPHLCDAKEPVELCASLRVVADLGGILAEHARTTCKPDEPRGDIVCSDANAPTACASLATSLERYAREHGATALEAFSRASGQQDAVLDFEQRHGDEIGATLDIALMLSHRCKSQPRVAKALTDLGFWGLDT